MTPQGRRQTNLECGIFHMNNRRGFSNNPMVGKMKVERRYCFRFKETKQAYQLNAVCGSYLNPKLNMHF